MVILGFLASGVFIKDSFISWDDQPTITTLDSIAAPIEDIQFPTVTVCNEEYKKPDDWTLAEIIMNAVAFECRDEYDEFITYPGYKELPLCNTTTKLRKDFEFMLNNMLHNFFQSISAHEDTPLAKMIMTQMNAEPVKQSELDLITALYEGTVVEDDLKKWLIDLVGYQFKTVDKLVDMKLNKSVENEYYNFNLFYDTSSYYQAIDEDSICGNSSECLFYKEEANDFIRTLSHMTNIEPKVSFGSLMATHLTFHQMGIMQKGIDCDIHSEEYINIHRFFANLSSALGFEAHELASLPELPAMFALVHTKPDYQPDLSSINSIEDEVFSIDWKTTYSRCVQFKGIDNDIRQCQYLWRDFFDKEEGMNH